ncbi:ABC transporter substrate-binding protein [Halorussus limi]|uniref:ABC transporter substrate-binding protein n=1 Tax=Halorussus limi TaxID=2938695 RepID=A0A8U0HT04_9EURY|nr:ABC transporter substrate-binding protein [Halorussus limi]UPV73999.1 ABC transporter substrate-binding protein [Halorussus limi]
MATGLTGCLGGSIGSSSITLGAILPLSSSVLGPIAEDHRESLRQAVEDINRAGGPLGRSVELALEKTDGTPKATKAAFDSLVDRGAVGLVGPLTSGNSLALADRLGEERVMGVSHSATNPKLETAGVAGETKFFGRTTANDAQQATVMAKILVEGRYIGAEKAAILYIDNAFGGGLADEIERVASGIETVRIPFSAGKDSYDEEISALMDSGADAVAFINVPGNNTVVEALGESDYEGQTVLSTGYLTGDTPDYMDGMYSASVAEADAAGEVELQQKLRDAAPLTAYTLQCYDALFLQALAIERAGEATGTAISENLRVVSGGRGHTVSVDDFGRAADLFAAGREVNYQGASGGVDLNENLEPLNPYVVERVENGSVTQLELLQESYFEGGRA